MEDIALDLIRVFVGQLIALLLGGWALFYKIGRYTTAMEARSAAIETSQYKSEVTAREHHDWEVSRYDSLSQAQDNLSLAVVKLTTLAEATERRLALLENIRRMTGKSGIG